MEELRFRIKSALEQANLTVYSLCTGDEQSRNRVNNQINRDTTISASTIALVLDRIPTLSAEWLLRGRGRMFHNTDPLAPAPGSKSITQVGGIGNTANTGTMSPASTNRADALSSLRADALSTNRADAPIHTDAEYSALERENIKLRAQLELMKQLFSPSRS